MPARIAAVVKAKRDVTPNLHTIENVPRYSYQRSFKRFMINLNKITDFLTIYCIDQ
jgi:hypothetical protein